MKAEKAYIQGAPAFQNQNAIDLAQLESRINAMASASGSGTSCEPELWLSFFFDGTNNSEDRDKQERAHSNISRLHLAHIANSPERNIWSLYLDGLGTYYRDEKTGKEDKGGTLGLGFGAGGDMRLESALSTLKYRIKQTEGQSASGRIRKIHIAIFGFSRGAALARAFARKLQEETRKSGDSYVWPSGSQEHPFHIYFMGIFDTVASVGTPRSLRKKTPWVLLVASCLSPVMKAIGAVSAFFTATADGHGEWASDLRIPPAPLVEQCVHFVAAHEVRLSFPVDLVLEKGKLPSNCQEYIYPGVHSDVGGGYLPGEDGRGAPGNDGLKLSQIPLHHMFQKAWAAGVPFLDPASSQWIDDRKKDFALDPTTIQLFNTYLDRLAPLAPGCLASLQAWILGHMGLYYQWRATVLDQDPPIDNSKKLANKKEAFIQGVRKHNKMFKDDIQRFGASEQDKDEETSTYRQLLVRAWKTYQNRSAAISTENKDVFTFFQTLVHDSVSDFRRDNIMTKGTTPTDDSRISFSRFFYHGGDKTLKIAKQDTESNENATAIA